MQKLISLGKTRFFGIFSALTLSFGHATAATFTVTNTNNGGIGSLRQAIQDANAVIGPHTIEFSLGSGTHTITLTTGEIEITRAMTIDPPSSHEVIISGDNNSRVFRITDSGNGTVTIRDVQVRDGTGGSGAGIEVVNAGTRVVFRRVQFFRNDAGTSNGGGLSVGTVNAADLGPDVTAIDCGFRQNDAQLGGGANLHTGTIDFRGCTFYLNEASAFAGGARIGDNDTDTATQSFASFTNCTFSENTAGTSGGALNVVDAGAAELNSCTITENTTTIGATVVASTTFGGADVSVQNTVIAANTNTTGDVGGSFTNLGHNFIGAGPGVSDFTDGVDGCIVGTLATPADPMLGVIGEFGGLTQVHLPLAGSPLIDAGDDAGITNPPYAGSPITDQRGLDRIVGTATDIGSTEFVDTIVVDTVDASGTGSLLEAITTANTTGGKTILFDAATFDDQLLTIPVNSAFAITDSVFIKGPQGGVILDGSNNQRVFNITSSGSGIVELKGLHITNGDATFDGGGLQITGSSTEVLIRDCDISDNHSDALGGGIYIEDATVTVLNSTIANNDSDSNGGGINANNGSTLNVLNSTISNNSADTNGGGLFCLNNTVTVINSTIVENTADADANDAGDGGGIRRGTGTAVVSVGNCLIALNSDDSPTADEHRNVSGTFTSLGHNLIAAGEGTTDFVNGTMGDQVGTIGSPVSPQLGSLTFNGGDTRTHRLLNASPARDAGDDTLLNDSAWPNGAPGRDQRGQFRIVNTSVDIGAVEWPDDQLLRIEPEVATMNEFGSDTASVRITRGNTETQLNVELEIGTGSVANGADLVSGANTFTLTMNEGVGTLIFNFNATSDATDEPDELLRIALVDTAGYSIDPNFATADLTIVDTDFVVTDPGNSGAGTLRDQKQAAEALGGGTVIIPQGTGPILLLSQVVFANEVIVEGNGETVDAQGASRVFTVSDSGDGCVRLKDLIITGGSASGKGGGILVSDCLEMVRCAVVGNIATSEGGGIAINSGAEAKIHFSSISGNVADGLGGGIHATLGSLELTNSTVAENSATGSGGGIAVEDSAFVVVNNTITANLCDSDSSGGGGGGGMRISNDPSIVTTLANNIIAGNFDTTANAGPGDIEPDMDGTSIASDGHNLIGDNSGETVTFPVGSPNANDDYVGDSATALDPLLVRSDSTPVYYTFDFNSEAYNNGDNGQIVTINSLTGNAGTDQRHFPRLDGITIDIGAVEMDFLAVIDPADSGFGTLRNRLDTANSRGHGTIIFLDTVFPGPTTITLTTGELPITGRSGISICATDTAPITIEATGPPPSRVMLIGASVTGGPPVDQRVLLKNLTLTGGDVIGSGGAIQVDGNFELTLDCCVLEGNTASLDGGAIAGGFLGSTAQLILTDTTFENNTARNGGAIAGFLTGIEARRCSFIGNSASSEGGALYLLDGPGTFGAEFFNCTISANTADQGGGGVMAQSGAVATFIHCTLTDNRSNDDGGSLSGDTEDGGGIHQIDPASVTIGNSIIAGNMNFSGSGGVDVEGKFISLGGNLVGTLGSATGFNAITDTFGTATAIDPLLGALAFNGAKTQNHRPLVGSPVAGLGETANASGLDTDQRGAVRIQGIDPEAGSIEYRADTISVTPGTLSFTEGSGLGTGIFFDRLFTNEELVIPLTVTGGSLDDIVLQLAGSVGSFDGSQITFPPGESQITLTITTVDDKLVEGTEVLDISVVGDEFATDGDSSVVTIDDNDLLVTNFTDSGPGRLREVLLNLPDGGTAIIPADPSGPVITLNSAIIIDGKSVEVCGPSTNGVGAVIDAQDLSHHFSIINSGVLNMENLTLTRGNSLVNGGSIINNGELNATACTFTENAATDAGGAIWANGSAVTNLTSNTFSSNEAGTQGGALFLSGNAILLHNTLTKNNATTQGGGIFTAGGTTSAQNTIIAGNTAPTNSDVTGTVSSNGGNLVGDGAGSTGFTHATDQVGTSLAPIDPVIGPLAMNGGPTMTHALWVGSPAIDGGRNLNIPVTDQRGLDRINDEGDPDIGAYEHQTVPFDYWAAYQAANQSLIAPSPPVITINTDGDGDGARDGIEFICGTDPFNPNDFPTLTPSLTTSGFLIAYPHSAIASEEEAILRFADINDPDDFDISPDAYVYPGPSAGNTRTRRGSVGRTGIPFFLGRLEYSDPGAAQ